MSFRGAYYSREAGLKLLTNLYSTSTKGTAPILMTHV